MTRLDRHVNHVRNKMAMSTFLATLAWTLLAFAVVFLVGVLLDRFLRWRLPHWQVWAWAGLGASVTGAIVWTVLKRPTERQAAIAIDQTLGLKEKFSTALYVRRLDDPFAAAAVRDAEVTADNVSLNQRFPVRFPVMFAGTAFAAIVALVTAVFLGDHYVFAEDASKKTAAQAEQEKALNDTKKLLAAAKIAIDSTPNTPADKEKFDIARREIADLQKNPIKDIPTARKSAEQVIRDMDAIKQKLKEQRQYAIAAKNDAETWKSIGKPLEDSSPLSKAQKDLNEGKFQEAAKDMAEVAKKFDQMKADDQKKAAEDLAKLANQMKKVAQDNQKQQQLQKQLQNMGANQQQVQQLANMMQAAANGDPQAQKQVQQAANQIAQNINNNPNLTPAQQQQIAQQVQNIAQQMQGNANNQQAAQQMANAAQGLAQAMAQKAQQNAQANAGQKGGQNQPGGQQQQANAGAQQGGKQQGNQPGGQQGGNQQANAQPGGNQPGGQQPGQQGGAQPGQQGAQPGQGQGPGQRMADANQQMQQQLDQLQQAADDAAQLAQQPQDGGGGNGADQGGQGGGGQDAAADGQGQGNGGEWKPGDPQPGGQGGQGGAAIAAGGLRPRAAEAPAAFKPEKAPSQTIDDGKILASQFVKAMSEKGKSTVGLSQVVESAQKEATDEVEQDRISRPAQNVVKKYFDDLKQGAGEE